jgi:hypothetical protein
VVQFAQLGQYQSISAKIAYLSINAIKNPTVQSLRLIMNQEWRSRVVRANSLSDEGSTQVFRGRFQMADIDDLKLEFQIQFHGNIVLSHATREGNTFHFIEAQLESSGQISKQAIALDEAINTIDRYHRRFNTLPGTISFSSSDKEDDFTTLLRTIKSIYRFIPATIQLSQNYGEGPNLKMRFSPFQYLSNMNSGASSTDNWMNYGEYSTDDEEHANIFVNIYLLFKLDRISPFISTFRVCVFTLEIKNQKGKK